MSKKKSIKSFVFGENKDLKMDQILGGYGQQTSYVWDFGRCREGGGPASDALVNCPNKPTDRLCSTTTSSNCPGVPTSTGCNTNPPSPPNPEPPIERTTMNPTSCWNTEFICYPDPY